MPVWQNGTVISHIYACVCEVQLRLCLIIHLAMSFWALACSSSHVIFFFGSDERFLEIFVDQIDCLRGFNS